jgi:hypothetical protein
MYCFFTQNGLGCILGELFPNSSGHPVSGPFFEGNIWQKKHKKTENYFLQL